MATIIPFTPPTETQFQFQAILDGVQHTLFVSWNFAAERYYLTAYDTQGLMVASRPMIGSPSGYDIPIFGSLFTSSVVYREASSQFEISDVKAQNQPYNDFVDNMLDASLNPFVLDVSVLS